MIEILQNKIFYIDTKNTTYAFRINEINYLEHLYYGNKISHLEDVSSLLEKEEFACGNGISYSKEFNNLTLESKKLEYSSLGKGDIRHPFIDITYNDATNVNDFVFLRYEIKKHEEMKTLPTSTGEQEDLYIYLKEKEKNVTLVLIYSPYVDEDIITRRSIVINNEKEAITLNKIMSLQLDLTNDNYIFHSFHGGWIREMKKYEQPCIIGYLKNESLAGVSSSRSNPFVMLSDKTATEEIGNVYGFNLIYSGNHEETVECDTFNHLRFLSGINSTSFAFELKEGEIFEAPECVMSYTSKGFTSLSLNFHSFINNHIVRGEWKDLPRPVLNNSWEAAYFKFNQAKILKMAKGASKAGVELFVLDDGWFSTRNDDTQGLGDWHENKKKLPKGLKGLSKSIQKMGMKFGIWVEPEMVNEKSSLYKAHPSWCVNIKEREQSLGRNQMFLDLTNDEVINYILDSMRYVFNESECNYVKWDMNRIMSCQYSPLLDKKHLKEFNHRYTMGLYKILSTLQKEFPHILFESCASGGNRFDLGMLCYSSQIWASDNTDPIERAKIQTGYSYGYPSITQGAHISASPNHQTLRRTPLETRFNVAFSGALGYEFNFNELSKDDFNKTVEQIKIYKKYRQYFLHNDYYRLKNDGNIHSWMLVSKDKKHACVVYVQKEQNLHQMFDNLKLVGLDENKKYKVHSDDLSYDIHDFGGLVNMVTPIHLKQDGKLVNILSKFIKMNEKGIDFETTGSILINAGLTLNQAFVGTGFNDKTRLMLQNASRLIFIDEIEK